MGSARQLFSPKYFYIFMIWLFVFQASAWFFAQSINVQSMLAYIVASLSVYFDPFVIVESNQVINSVSLRYVVVNEECTGFSLIATLSALFFALPISSFHKLLTLCCTFVLIEIENVMRIMHLFYLVETQSPYFNFYHLYFWQALNFIYALTIFFILLIFIKKEENAAF